MKRSKNPPRNDVVVLMMMMTTMPLLALLRAHRLLLDQVLSPTSTHSIRPRLYLLCRCAVGIGIEGARACRTAKLAPVVTVVLFAETAAPARPPFMVLMPLGKLVILLCRQSLVILCRVPGKAARVLLTEMSPAPTAVTRAGPRGTPCQGSVPVHTGWTAEIAYEGRRPTE